MQSGADIARWGEDVRRRLAAWWEAWPDRACAETVATYYGAQSVHAVLERTAWHAAQHVRQLMMALDGLGIEADGPLKEADLAGLPLPEKVWDD